MQKTKSEENQIESTNVVLYLLHETTFIRIKPTKNHATTM